MDLILTLLSPIFWVLQMLLSILLWVVWQLVWIAVWLLLPVAIVAFVALKLAEKTFGEAPVRAWVKARALKYGGGLGERMARGALAASVLPFRVSLWFVIYTIWHALVGLLWRPKWTPWERAWAKRWKPGGARAATAPPQPKRA